jgi:uncharacterized spore protein YtfJ
MSFEEVVKELAEVLKKEGNTHAVFGEVQKLETKTIIPVACVQFGGGGGGMIPGGSEKAKTPKPMFGGGGGGGLAIFPVGYLHEEHGEVVFTAIHLDPKNRPLLGEASYGLGKAIDSVTHAFTEFTKKRLSSGARHRARA